MRRYIVKNNGKTRNENLQGVIHSDGYETWIQWNNGDESIKEPYQKDSIDAYIAKLVRAGWSVSSEVYHNDTTITFNS